MSQNNLPSFPDQAQPAGLLERARAEQEGGRHREAEALLRQCRAEFPAFAPAAAALAELLWTLGRHEECLTAWQAVIHDFPESLEGWWLEAMARAERRCGHLREAATLLRQCRANFPAFAPAAAALADLLAE